MAKRQTPDDFSTTGFLDGFDPDTTGLVDELKEVKQEVEEDEGGFLDDLEKTETIGGGKVSYQPEVHFHSSEKMP
jgi:hypothetical protein